MMSSPRQSLSVERSPWLRGVLRIPGDAAMTHLALLGAAISRGRTLVSGALRTSGTAATLRTIADLGADVDAVDGSIRVAGLGAGGLLAPRRPLAFGPDALAVELAMGLCGTYDFAASFSADPDVSSRPFVALLDGLRSFGAHVDEPDPGRLPLTLRGPRLGRPAAIVVPRAAPATKAALILAALNVPGRSVLHDAEPGWTHAERLLRRFGAIIDVAPGEGGMQSIAVTGLPELRAAALDIPADPALAALGAIAASIVPGSEVEAHRVLLNPARTAVLSALVAMGAVIDVRRVWRDGEEEVADLVFRHAPLRGIALAAHHVAPPADELPLLAAAAAYAEGNSVFYLPTNLSLMARARLRDLSRLLAVNGVRNALGDESFAVSPRPEVPGGGSLQTEDPGLALALLIVGMGARERVTLADGSVIEERFPGFVAAFEAIGAGFAQEGRGQ